MKKGPHALWSFFIGEVPVAACTQVETEQPRSLSHSGRVPGSFAFWMFPIFLQKDGEK